MNEGKGETLDEAAVLSFLHETCAGLDVLHHAGDHYLYYDPDRTLDPTRRLPFATIVTSNAHDAFSDLDRPGVYRLNLGLSPATFRARFGPAPFPSDPAAVAATGHDFTQLDHLLPHPVYGNMFWVAILNPSAASLPMLTPLIEEAHARAVAQHQRQAPAPGR